MTEIPEGEYLNDGVLYNKLLGTIDLLVIDANGNTHIFDYKTSQKSY
ncbi:MAG: hypothetical protein HUJ56_05780 [Erysipelotrichaceae bacterium]|nr:hypothetical protein [Erysipelotrichaceae bacterium]